MDHDTLAWAILLELSGTVAYNDELQRLGVLSPEPDSPLAYRLPPSVGKRALAQEEHHALVFARAVALRYERTRAGGEPFQTWAHFSDHYATLVRSWDAGPVPFRGMPCSL